MAERKDIKTNSEEKIRKELDKLLSNDKIRKFVIALGNL